MIEEQLRGQTLTPVGSRRWRLAVVLSAVPLVVLVLALVALYPFHKARQDRADDRFRQMSIEVTRDLSRFRPAGAETVNRSVVAAACSRAFSSVKAQELLTCPNLAELDLSGCDPIDPAALARLSALRVRTLSLADTPADDDLLSRLAGWPALDELNLDRTRISAAGLRELLGRRPVSRVSVSGAKVSGADVDALRAAFPDVDIRSEPVG